MALHSPKKWVKALRLDPRLPFEAASWALLLLFTSPKMLSALQLRFGGHREEEARSKLEDCPQGDTGRVPRSSSPLPELLEELNQGGVKLGAKSS